MINCVREIVQRVASLLFLQLNFNKLYPMTVTKIVEIRYAITDKRRWTARNTSEEKLTRQGLYMYSFLLRPSNNLTWACDPLLPFDYPSNGRNLNHLDDKTSTRALKLYKRYRVRWEVAIAGIHEENLGVLGRECQTATNTTTNKRIFWLV